MTWSSPRAQTPLRSRTLATFTPIILSTLVVVTYFCQLRWTVASTTPWQCDEIPLLVRFTGLCGQVANEQEAHQFTPSFYSFYMGAWRSLRPPTDTASIHTTTGFWVNLTTHLFGATPSAGRLMPFFFSVSAILVAALGAWLLTRNILAACVAACLVAASPHAIAYAAQARGYAEAMCLAPLLLIALAFVRRKPSSSMRVVLLLICCIQLSMTVYTIWIYWVAPVLLLALFILPRTVQRQDRQRLRSTLTIATVSVFMFMVVYTLDRLGPLHSSASIGGIPLDSGRAVLHLLQATATHLLPVAPIAFLAVAIGLLAMFRSRGDSTTQPLLWVAMLGAGMVIPAIMTIAIGSAGYPRNFGYLVVPLAIVAAVGVGRIVVILTAGRHTVLSSLILATLLLGGAAWAKADVESRVRGIIYPDWGGAVQAMDRTAETVGPRWFCHSMANHWQINWYRDSGHLERCLEKKNGQTIEVILGTQRGEAGYEVIYQRDAKENTILPKRLPEWLSDEPIRYQSFGVGLRRWQGLRVGSSLPLIDPTDESATGPGAPGLPVPSPPHSDPLMLVLLAVPTASPLADPEDTLRRERMGEFGLAFKPVLVRDRVVYSWLTTSRDYANRSAFLQEIANATSSTLHLFRLSNLATY